MPTKDSSKPPACPSCRTPANVKLITEAGGQTWRCERCGVEWKVALTPRTER